MCGYKHLEKKLYTLYKILFQSTEKGKTESETASSSVVSDSVTSWKLQPSRLCPCEFPSKNTGVGCHSLLKGIFPTPGLNSGLLHYREICYCLSHQRLPPTSFIKLVYFDNKPEKTSQEIKFIPMSLIKQQMQNPKQYNSAEQCIVNK